MYSANKGEKNINPVYRVADYSEDYGSYIANFEAPYDQWDIVSVDSVIYQQEGVSTWQEFRNKYGDDWKKRRYEMKATFCFQNRNRVVSLNTMQKPSREIVECIEMSKANRNRVFAVGVERDKPTYVYNGRTLAFYEKKFRLIDGVESPSEIITNIWTDISFLSLGNEGGVDLPNGKKPEKLLKRILELVTTKGSGDIVLDFFSGTGTTGAVAHKLGLQYILCEQMDYIEDLTVERLKGVLQGESGGVSDLVDWTGGGSFVYCELAKQNQTFVERIRDSEDNAQLSRVWADMRATGYISHYVDPREIDEHAEDFKSLSFQDKKRLFLDLLDKNLLYVNYCDMYDAESGLSEADKAFTRSFYEEV